MLTFSRKLFQLLTLFIQLLAFSTFLLGFFPLKQSLPGTGKIRNYTLYTHVVSHPVKQFDKTVLILIDALRSDFVYEHEHMPFVNELLKSQYSERYIIKAHPPTVTLPRIKALTSGTIPGFVDVVLNFDSKSLKDDNIVTQAYRAGRNIVFYGDDTWIKLFPDHFTRSEGTTSFFVTDYTEVDDNVTRHIDTELSLLDWDLMILHYLGLDHIGHTVGPSSPLVPPKLQEMDRVIQKIYKSLENQGEKFLILVCGDHGMSDQGSHGGASDREILVPAVFLSSSYQKYKSSWKSQRDSLQIDLAPTLSVLMGLPIPNNNLGQVLLGALKGLSDEEILNVMYINTQQIVKLMEASIPDFEKESSYDLYLHAVELHKSYLDNRPSHSETDLLHIVRSYESAMEAMSSKVAGSLTTYDIYGMLLAIMILCLTLTAAVLGSLHDSQSVCLLLSPPFLIAVTILVIFGHMTACTSQSFYIATFCGRSLSSVAMQLAVLGSILFLSTTILSFNKWYIYRKWFPKSALTRLLWTGTVFHTLSFGSSSFVEEEHQSWYFFVMTFHLVAMVMQVKGHVTIFWTKTNEINAKLATESNFYDADQENELRNGKMNNQFRAVNKNEMLESQCQQLFMSIRKKSTGNPDEIDKTSHSSAIALEQNSSLALPWRLLLPWKQIAGILTVMLLGRFLRTINQTGNKWLDTPDLADWLMMPKNKPALSTIVFISHLVILVANGIQFDIEYFLFMVGIYTCYQYRITTGAVNSILDLNTPNEIMSKGILEARAVFYLVILMNLISLIKWCCLLRHNYFLLPVLERKRSVLCLKCVQTFQLSWILLMTLVLRTHNTLLVAMVIVQEVLLWRFVIRKVLLPANFLALFCWWMGQAVFFQQGNSNSISTVDVSAGYVGLQDYQPVLVGVLLFCSTYSGPVYWLIALVKYILLLKMNMEGLEKRNEDNRLKDGDKSACNTTKTALQDSIQALTIERLATLLLYCVVVTSQRYHLFVWTVFSPKLLYEGMLTVTVSLFSVIVLTLV